MTFAHLKAERELAFAAMRAAGLARDAAEMQNRGDGRFKRAEAKLSKAIAAVDDLERRMIEAGPESMADVDYLVSVDEYWNDDAKTDDILKTVVRFCRRYAPATTADAGTTAADYLPEYIALRRTWQRVRDAYNVAHEALQAISSKPAYGASGRAIAQRHFDEQQRIYDAWWLQYYRIEDAMMTAPVVSIRDLRAMTCAHRFFNDICGGHPERLISAVNEAARRTRGAHVAPGFNWTLHERPDLETQQSEPL